jgi:hypothetical protein
MHKTGVLSAVAGVLLLLAAAAFAADEGKVTLRIQTDEGTKISLETGAGSLRSLIAGTDVRCDAEHDPETRRMMASLTRQGEGGVYRGEEEDGHYVARRRDGMMRIEKRQEDGGTTVVEMPWDVARCLMEGIAPPGDLGRRLARGEAKLRFEARGEGGSFSIRLE